MKTICLLLVTYLSFWSTSFAQEEKGVELYIDAGLSFQFQPKKFSDYSDMGFNFGGEPVVYRSQVASSGPTLLWTHKASALIKWFDRWEDGFATGDLNDDDIPDVVFGTSAGEAVAVNGSSGETLWTYPLPNTSESVNVDIIDVDGDGVLDVVAGGKATSGNTTIVALNKDKSLKWQATGDYQETTDFAFGDVNGDDYLDVAAAIGKYSHSGGQVVVFDGRNGDKVWDVTLGNGIPFGIDAKDVNSDGDMEVSVTNYDNKVFFIDGATNTILWSKLGIYYGRDVIIENVDDDSLFEIVSVMGNTYCHDSDGNLDWSNTSGVGENLKLCNPTGDDKVEILIANPWTGNASLVDGATGDVLWTRTEAGAADLGDIDGDGLEEIVVASMKYYDPNFPTHHVRCVDGEDSLLWEYDLPKEPSAVVVANIDNDDEKEVLVTFDSTLIALDVVPTGVIEPFPITSFPKGYKLWQNYPNPFNPTTTIAFYVPKTSDVILKIYNILGEEVAKLVSDRLNAGSYSYDWDATNKASGVYLYRLSIEPLSTKRGHFVVGQAGEFVETRKMMLIR